VPAELEPPELARLVEFSVRSRAGDWSLRSALVRYAQAEPVRVGQVLELVRRIEAALHSQAKVLAADGAALWEATVAPTVALDDPNAALVGLLRATAELDRLADVVVAWAVDRHGPQPDADVDAVVRDVTERLDALKVPREERQGPPRRRG
jgi:hypothetical protein